jgi:thiol-disulfide isomerase/thioredoxin
MKASVSFMLLLISSLLPVRAQEVKVIQFESLQQILSGADDTLNVVNFWATWCGPCVKELPYFEALAQKTQNEKVRVLLVSMDDFKTLDSKVKPFVKQRKIKSEVVLLNEPDLDTWVDKLVPEWSGALPMTLILNDKRKIRKYIGKPVKEAELYSIINQYKL